MPSLSKDDKRHEALAKATVRVVIHMWKYTSPSLHEKVQARVETELLELGCALWPQFDLPYWTEVVRKALRKAQVKALAQGIRLGASPK